MSDQLSAKYGKPYALACRENSVGTVSEKLMHKLSVQAPPKLTVEKYMVEIAKYYNVEYEPDPQVGFCVLFYKNFRQIMFFDSPNPGHGR